MGRRSKMSMSHSKQHFTKHAVRSHVKNVSRVTRAPMRGGIRL